MRRTSSNSVSTASTVDQGSGRRIEGSCTPSAEARFKTARSARGIERLEARFTGEAFAPHRHDTYALGLTLHGVQQFRYRDDSRHSLPGNVIVLHPDEVHDGAAGSDDILIYRMAYFPPDLIGAVDGHRHALPFVADPVVRDPVLWDALSEILSDMDREPDSLASDDAMMRIATRLNEHAGALPAAITPLARQAVLKARDFLVENCGDAVHSEALETVTGLDRFELARQFRRLLGTSPHRFLIMRRLDRAKRLLAEGCELADAAVACGFSDQPHFTHHFRKSFGITPGRWLTLNRRSLIA